ncbi:hypothetical protein [Paenibacillus sp. MMS18-CY102]|uniref:hypothetical protein n=1 Tax=Paenibacillus sp. MMS18-CY102 TaxID=2682849 RepID=UPI0013663B2A|nr:hypothetical protein [Paenibacillus sp. MMS18-CY102]MWC27334.1 hypothetical protein [Paenibacillus sp. MMS18-CY102]
MEKFNPERIRIGAYKENATNKIIIFPCIRIDGPYTDINKPIMLPSPHHAEEIGDACLECIQVVASKNYSADDIGGAVVSTKRERDMPKLYLYLSIAFEPEIGYTLLPTEGKKDGAHYPLTDSKLKLGLSATNTELGEKVIRAFDLCR